MAKKPRFGSDFYYLRGRESEHHYKLTLHGRSALIWLRFLQFEGGNRSTTMNVMTCTLIIRRIFIVYCLVGYLCPDFAPIYHDLVGCPDFYFSSLKTLI